MDALVPDDLWAVISPLLPLEPEKLKGGRPRASDRSALAGIILALRTAHAVEARAWEGPWLQRQNELAAAR